MGAPAGNGSFSRLPNVQSGVGGPSADRYRLTVNRDFEAVLTGITKQHGDNWFFGPIKETLRHLYSQPGVFASTAVSFELWEGDALVAGEIGLVTGANYTSLSGFFTTDGSGTVQICAMAKALDSLGFEMLDLGMVME
jgi:Leu/Phe-tRNA-protein transferase